ncbi:MAG: Rrf2 family transcriptional regulator [Clostridiales Family XIII bacterium]|nr:Rrf2 family transcriptional regulator [Clostridiales Family XIII bacterium]
MSIQNNIISRTVSLQERGFTLVITRETDYSMRILRALFGKGKIYTKEICENEFLPQQFAYRILKKMETGGLVRITRGIDGGVELIADLKSISIFDLLNILDKKQEISICMQPDFQCKWTEQNGTCIVHQNLYAVQQQMNSLLEGKSVYQLLFETESGTITKGGTTNVVQNHG